MDADRFVAGWFLWFEFGAKIGANVREVFERNPWMLRGYATAAYMANIAPATKFDQSGGIVAWVMLENGEGWVQFYTRRHGMLQKLIGDELFAEMSSTM